MGGRKETCSHVTHKAKRGTDAVVFFCLSASIILFLIFLCLLLISGHVPALAIAVKILILLMVHVLGSHKFHLNGLKYSFHILIS